MKSNLIIQKIFGAKKFHSNLFIITNINKIYKNLIKKYPIIELSSGWWKRALIKIKNKKIEILKIPPGNNVIDCFRAIKHRVKKVIWLGYGGGLNKKVKIGDLVLVNKENCFQTDGLIQQTNYYKQLVKKGIEYVDMECEDVFSFTKQSLISLKYISIISDLPLTRLFFKIDKYQTKKINNGIKQLVEIIPDFIRETKILKFIHSYFPYRLPTKKEFNLLVKKFKLIYKKTRNYKVNASALLWNKNFTKRDRLLLNEFKNFYEFFPLVVEQLKKFVVKKLLIKPNLVSKEVYPETSDLQLLCELIFFIKKKIPSIQITIADGPSFFFDDNSVFDNPFLNKLAKKNIKIVNVLKEEFLQYKTNSKFLPYLNLPTFLNNFDFLINLSCFKEHNRASYSSAKKNLMGLLPDFERLRFHRMKNDISKAIDELANILGSSLTIIDGRYILGKAQQRIYGGEVKKGFGIIVSNNLSVADSLSYKLFKKMK